MSAALDWREANVPFIAGISDTRKPGREPYRVRPLGEILSTASPYKLPKENAFAFIPSLYAANDARSHGVQRQHGRFVALVGDIDQGNHSLSAIRDAIAGVAGGCAWTIYSTASAKPDDKRWRIIVPLAEPAPYEAWHDAQLALIDLMAGEFIEMDSCATRPGQISFLPNVPNEARGSDGEPLFFERTCSDTAAPGLSLAHGPVAQAMTAIREKRALDEAERERIRAEAARRKASRPANSGGGGSIIEAFCRGNDLNRLLERYGYERNPRDGRDWRSPMQTSKSFATRVIEDGKWISLSGSDAVIGLGEQCSSGCFGDAFDLFVHFEYNGDRTAALRELHSQFAQTISTPGTTAAGHDRDLAPSGSSPRQAGKPEIQIIAGQLHIMASKGEQALRDADAPFYVRGERLVRPVVDELPAAHGKMTKSPRLRSISKEMMVDHLSRHAKWTKYDGRKKDKVLADPPFAVAQIILERDGEWQFKRLAGVITTPTLRPDGTVLSEAGYDEQTRLLLIDPPRMPEIPPRPSREEGASALKLLDNLLDEFPFVDEASRSVAMSALISPVVRGAMPVVPLHATTAPVAGSGKSYIIDVASAINLGQRAPVIAAGRDEAETEKRLVAALLGGQPIVSIDNVNGQLGGDFLCQMIERPVVTPRILGVSKNERIESRATTFATGNNIQLLGDMTRRVLLCTLDPNTERPELRRFTGKPYETVISDRGRYIAAALTVVRSFVCAVQDGQAEPVQSLASFEGWSDLVRSALVWHGKADPIETMEAARADDPVTASLRALYASWHEAAGQKALAAGEVVKLASEQWNGDLLHPEFNRSLREVAESRRGELDARALGRYLGRHKGRVMDGLKLQDHDDTHAKQKLWSVVRV